MSWLEIWAMLQVIGIGIGSVIVLAYVVFIAYLSLRE